MHTAVRDQAGLARTTELLLRQGFRTYTAITPAQLATINAVFTPTPDEVRTARETVALLSDTTGVAVTEDGRMVDRAVLRAAEEVLVRATIE